MNPQDKCWQVHRHLAEHTDQRLTLVRNAPGHILLAGADADISRSLLAKRYPLAVFEEYDSRADFWRLPQPRARAVSGKTDGQGRGAALPIPDRAAARSVCRYVVVEPRTVGGGTNPSRAAQLGARAEDGRAAVFRLLRARYLGGTEIPSERKRH